jgi:hypothetical protein
MALRLHVDLADLVCHLGIGEEEMKRRARKPVSDYFKPAKDNVHAHDHYYADHDAVYQVFTGDVIFRFCVSKVTIGQEGANYIAGEICKVLNDWADSKKGGGGWGMSRASEYAEPSRSRRNQNR